jgi:hypothetical protein
VVDSPFSNNAVGHRGAVRPRGAKGLCGSWWCDNHHTHHLISFKIADNWGLVWRGCTARVLTCTLRGNTTGFAIKEWTPQGGISDRCHMNSNTLPTLVTQRPHQTQTHKSARLHM